MPAVKPTPYSSNIGIDGLFQANAWDTTTLTYSFPTAATDYEPGYGDAEPLSLSPLSSTVAQLARGVFAQISEISNLDLVEVAGPLGDIRVGGNTLLLGAPAYTYGVDTPPESGDVWIDPDQFGTGFSVGTHGYHTGLLHEIGHAVGLDHPHGGVILPEELDDMLYTVMSYRTEYLPNPVGSGFTNEEWDETYNPYGYTNLPYSYAQTYMPGDIAALQHLYGADFTTRSSNTTYSWLPTSGVTSANGVPIIEPAKNFIFATIWDGGGTDTYNLAAYTDNLLVDLRPGTSSRFSADQSDTYHGGNIWTAKLYHGNTSSLIENVTGGSGNDTIRGNQANNVLKGGQGDDTLIGYEGDDALYGSSYADRLYGDAGADLLEGSGGADLFVFRELGDSIGGKRDTIVDMTPGLDKIDLRNIDAKTTVAGDQAFTLISGGFTGVAGQLRATSTMIVADVNGDKVSDLIVYYTQQPTLLKATDFLL